MKLNILEKLKEMYDTHNRCIFVMDKKRLMARMRQLAVKISNILYSFLTIYDTAVSFQ